MRHRVGMKRTRTSRPVEPYGHPLSPLWKSVLLGLLSLQATAAAVVDHDRSPPIDGHILQQARQQSEAQIRQRFLTIQPHECMDVIVTLAGAYGNADPDLSLGASEFERTTAITMSCISIEMYETLMTSPEVLLVEIDSPVEPATGAIQSTETTELAYVDGEVVTWGADLVLQSKWEDIPDPDPAAPNFAVCVVDSGLLVSHQDIPFTANEANIEGTVIDLPDDNAWDRPVAYAYHGTHTVGTMMAAGYNEEGLRGIIPRSDKFKLLIARVFGDGLMGSAKTSSIEKAVEWCANKGARVINLSLASNTPTMNSMLLYTRIVEEENILVVAASGNLGTIDPSYPAAYDHVMSVGSIDENHARSSFSQYGSTLDVVAPGRNVYSTVPSSGLLTDGSDTYDAGPMAFTPVHNVPISGPISDCGLGDVPCPDAAGRLCLVEHSLGLPFQVLAQHCESGGGVSLVVYPGFGAEGLEDAVMELDYTGSISVVTVSRDDGLRLLAQTGTLASISFTVPAYQVVSGTSMSASHVSAVAAKIWAARPECTNAQIREALESTAQDLGTEGRDDEYGHGLVRGVDAYNYLLGLPPPCGTGSNSVPHPLGNPDRPVNMRKVPTPEPDKPRMCNPALNPFCVVELSAPERRRKALRGL